MNKRVCIIIVNFNQNCYTIECIKSIQMSDYLEVEIILVDNSTNSVHYKEIDFFLQENTAIPIFLIRTKKNLGYVGGVNLGLVKAKELNAGYVLIMNNDTIVDKEAIGSLLNTCIIYNKRAIVTGKVYHYDNAQKLQQIGFRLKNKDYLNFKVIGIDEIDEGQYETITEMDLLDDVFWLFNIELYNKIGGYNPFFWFNSEQADFALRARKAGYKLIYTPKAKIWHKGSASVGGRDKNPKLAYWHIQSTLIFHFLHQSRGYFVLFYLGICRNILTSLMKEVFFPLKKPDHFAMIKAKIKALSYFNGWLIRRNLNSGENPFN